MTKINLLSPITFVLALGGCVPMPLPVTPDEAPCPCPDLALAHHPEDPDSLGECRVKSRTGMAMDAGDHPACGREARERGGGR